MLCAWSVSRGGTSCVSLRCAWGSGNRCIAVRLREALLSGLSDAEILAYAERTKLPRYTANTIVTPQQLLEDANRTRREGYVVSNEDVSPGIGAIGAPVRDYTRQVVAAISLSGIAATYTPERIAELAATVEAAAHRISRQMGYSSKAMALLG